jgi:acetylornithine deacetylase/succinyl-diaminopimelate desuccinylase-like protein
LKEYIQNNKELLLKTLKELCLIPAPSHHEEKRAEYCKAWLERYGAKGVYIDKALNVVFPINCENSKEITVVVAHTDTVFPDTEPMPYKDDGERIYCPGVSDDTASLAVMLVTAKYFIENKISPKKGIMFVCNSCEEGLGNLKGTRQIFEDYEGRIGQFLSFDSNLNKIADKCVGSHRYEVEVQTIGGHSYLAFGNPNAIAELSKIIGDIYNIQIPKRENSRTSYNVGTIEGGTSVNTIAQSAKMLCEYRSDNKECLAIMEKAFNEIFACAKARGVDISVTKIGERPCMGKVDLDKIEQMAKVCEEIIHQETGFNIIRESSSTDCNIPLSLGIPALCIGVYTGEQWHTRKEWVDKASLPLGLQVAIKSVISLTENI